LGIFRKQRLIQICQNVAPLLLHPNTWIRFAVVALMVSTATKLSLADVHCFLIPILRPYLIRDIIEVTKMSLLESLQTPVSVSFFWKHIISMCLSIYLSKYWSYFHCHYLSMVSSHHQHHHTHTHYHTHKDKNKGIEY
jgi:phosphoinositide-3-kinase regulatory subunit 4